MSYIDMSVAIGTFMVFFALSIMLAVNYFSKEPLAISVTEFKEKADSLSDDLFSTAGSPDDWEDSSLTPSELGLSKTIFRMPINVIETSGSARVNEPVVVEVTFDDDCSSKAWNNTVRIYDNDFNATLFEFGHPTNCPSQYLNKSWVTFLVNASAGETKKYWIFYYEDTDIPSPNYTSLSFSTSSWSPSDGDSWSDGTTSWSRYGGASASPSLDSTDKWSGSSIQIQDSFSSQSRLGLEYNPAANISAASYPTLSAWVYVDDMASIAVNVSVNDNYNTIWHRISGMKGNEWYHFSKNFTSTEWSNWTNFNISTIDSIRFFMSNSSAGLTRQLKVDQLHLGLVPLDVKDYPEENYTVVSGKKVSAMDNLTYEQIKTIVGEDYKFRVEIS